MDVVDVDLLDTKTFQAAVQLCAGIGGIAGNAFAIGAFSRDATTDNTELGSDDQTFAAVLDGTTKEFFVMTIAIDIGGVDEIDSEVEDARESR